MIRFGIIRFGSVNDTEASVFGYSVSTCFDWPLDFLCFKTSKITKIFKHDFCWPVRCQKQKYHKYKTTLHTTNLLQFNESYLKIGNIIRCLADEAKRRGEKKLSLVYFSVSLQQNSFPPPLVAWGSILVMGKC